ncbi:MAG: hypothetical protein Q8O35_09160 [Humidesulfovibrio sp.]|uniref:hypothetical protein n=1 Tax=Humidesulfovibrio sp. TaxID=2910988 RepID=UPI002734CF6C|nr:hypothetical protein [Humidesulfovibrio sp.]MDP2848348.1 hypothetical protein [Humidesulfovibrio sp.]
MTYDSTTMRLMGGVPGQQLFLYRTADAVAAVSASGYFNNAIAEYNLSSGDMILTVSGFGALPVLDGLVASVSGGNATTGLLA